MASILKVSQLQKPDGSTPTAADLGINDSGTLLQSRALIGSTGNLGLTSETYVDVDTFTITTRGDSSLIVFMDTQQYIKSVNTTNPAFRLLIDGVVQGGGNTTACPSWYHTWYGQNAARETQFNYFTTGVLPAGTHTMTIQAMRYNTGTITLAFQSAKQRYLLQEIAQ